MTTTLADVPAMDPASPWLQLAVQGGALGLLFVLVWQLPKLISALKTWRNETEQAHRDERTLIREDGKAALQSILENHQENVKRVLNHCDEGAKRRDLFLQTMQREVENLQEQQQTLQQTLLDALERRTARRKQQPDPLLRQQPPDQRPENEGGKK